MKTAVSIPDPVFQGAETLARRLRISRSQLYARALGEYVRRHAPESVTESLDRLCAEIGEDEDLNRFNARAARHVLARGEW